MQKQRELEETNSKLLDQMAASKGALMQNLEISETQFYDLQVIHFPIPLLNYMYSIIIELIFHWV